MRVLFSFTVFVRNISRYMNSFRADGRVNCLKTSDVSELWAQLWAGPQPQCIYKRQIWYDQPDHFPWGWRQSVSETSEVFKQLTRLSAREEFIQFCRFESLKTYISCCVKYLASYARHAQSSACVGCVIAFCVQQKQQDVDKSGVSSPPSVSVRSFVNFSSSVRRYQETTIRIFFANFVSDVRGSHSSRGKAFCLLKSVHTGLGAHPAPNSVGTGVLSRV
jgi:hypothetical protein